MEPALPSPRPPGLSFATLPGNLSLTIWQLGASEVLITGSGSSEVAGGNGTETIIGGSVLRTGSDTNPGGPTTNAQSHLEAGLAALDANGNYQLAPWAAGQDVLSAGSGSDLVVASPTGSGAILYGGSGTDILVGGGGQNIIDGGSGQDTILGGNLFNIINSGSVAGSSSTIAGGNGLNFETAGSGNNTLFDYADAATWNAASTDGVAAFHVTLVPPAPIAQLSKIQLDDEKLIPAILQSNQLSSISNGATLTGGVALDGKTITYSNQSNENTLFFQAAPATSPRTPDVLDQSNGGNVFVGEMVGGTGIPNGTTITGVVYTLSVSGKTVRSNGQTLVVTGASIFRIGDRRLRERTGNSHRRDRHPASLPAASP